MIYEYIESIEKLAKSKALRDGKLDDYLRQVLKDSAQVMNCARVNVWTLTDDKMSLDCLFSYHKTNNSFDKEPSLSFNDFPNYFGNLTKNDIIVSSNARTEEINKELVESYLIAYDIYSMIDIPLRSEGEMIGVICFEHTGQRHTWTREEQRFTLSVAQLVSLALEAQKKREYRIELEKLLMQKEVLISEINHRVNNNISVIVNLIKTLQCKAHDAYHESLFRDLKNKVRALASVQDQLRTKEDVDDIQISHYISELIENLRNSYDKQNKVAIEMDIDDFSLDISHAIPLGLIANEVISHAFKYANIATTDHPTLTIDCHRENSHVSISFKDNGVGIDDDTGHGLGIELIKSLGEQIGGTIEIVNEGSLEIDVEFPV